MDARRCHLYFAYGSNLNLDGMASRCPDSEPVGRAILDGWELTFRGVADITPKDGSHAHGVVWRISDRDLDRLDTYEGWPSMYRRELLAVTTGDEALTAIAYVMNDDYVGLPSPSYFETIRCGYEQWDLPIPELELALTRAKRRLGGEGVTSLEPDGTKRLRPSRQHSLR